MLLTVLRVGFTVKEEWHPARIESGLQPLCFPCPVPWALPKAGMKRAVGASERFLFILSYAWLEKRGTIWASKGAALFRCGQGGGVATGGCRIDGPLWI
jgi:hypothetical protein